MAFGSFSSGKVVRHDGAKAPCKIHYSDYRLNALIDKKEKTEIFYGVGPRFMMTKTKQELKNIKSVLDFNFCDNPESIVSYSKVSVIVLDHEYNFVRQIDGQEADFNSEQLELLNTVPYSTDLLIRADFKQFGMLSNQLESNYTTPHITVVPEKQAVYRRGEQTLVEYVKNNTLDYASSISKAELRPGKVRFTVSTTGKVENVFLESTSGDVSFDNDVKKLISKMPGSWTPAEDENGNKVEQQLVFTFGIVGC